MSGDITMLDVANRINDKLGQEVYELEVEIEQLRNKVVESKKELLICAENVNCGDHKPCALLRAIELLEEIKCYE